MTAWVGVDVRVYVQTGQTPRREIYRRNKSRVYRYASIPRYRIPILFVPNLGISRPYIFDLLPGSSFFEYLGRAGFDCYLLDWGTFGPEDHGLCFEDAVDGTLRRAWDAVLETAGTSELSVIGYCMGVPMALSLLAARPSLRATALVSLAGLVDFSRAGLFRRWLDSRWFPVDRLAGAWGVVPPETFWIGGTLLRPTMFLSAAIDVWWHASDPRYVDEMRGVAKWVTDFVPVPDEFFRDWVRDFYQENKLYRGCLRLGGRPAVLSAVRCPVLAVAATGDPVAPPGSVRPLLEAVASTDTRYLELPGGHLALMLARVAGAAERCWAPLADWLALRSDPRPPPRSA